jgi:glycosyltransferase involved in cell wall biosynthesis
MKKCVVGIDASRNRSGGAKHHLVGILGAVDPAQFGIGEVHVWAYRTLLDALPDFPWLVKHNPPPLERSLRHQVLWQRWSLPHEMRRHGCDVLLSTDAGTVGVFEPSVVMSRDMLSYEPGEMRRYGISKAWVRLFLLRYVQARSLKRARGAIFLTRYAADTIQRFTGALANVMVIPHGVGEAFRQAPHQNPWPRGPEGIIRCLYVSNAEMYKHQWHVVRATSELRKRGHNIVLTLAGGGEGRAQELVDQEIARTDPHGEFVRLAGAVRHDHLPGLLAESDLFVFASSCENMPNTLLEGMASGLPIACSNRGPMPEVLEDGGVYFDPEDAAQIAAAIERLVTDAQVRATVVRRAKDRSEQFSWARCARETWTFLRANVPERTCEES